jgi:hypothetical protein
MCVLTRKRLILRTHWLFAHGQIQRGIRLRGGATCTRKRCSRVQGNLVASMLSRKKQKQTDAAKGGRLLGNIVERDPAKSWESWP